MKIKNIFNVLALAMMMPAMLLTTACSSDDDAVVKNENKKGYALPVTINVTRDDATRATYNAGDKKLEFSTGDKLYVTGMNATAGLFAGTLTWQSGGTFSGTIYSEEEYPGTAAALLAEPDHVYVAAVLLPSGYEDYDFLTVSGEGYSLGFSYDDNKAFAATKATAVEQFSFELANSYATGFALSPRNAILNFTITDLTPNATGVAVSLTGAGYPDGLNISKTVSADGSGNATFAVGVDASQNDNLDKLTLTVGGNAIPLGSNALVAGKIYNVNRSANRVVWDFSKMSGIHELGFSSSFSYKGVTLQGTVGTLDLDKNMINAGRDLTFTAPAGRKFTSIVINAAGGLVQMDGFTFDSSQGTATWSGSATSNVSIPGYGTIDAGAEGITSIVFYLE